MSAARWLASLACLVGALFVSWPRLRAESAGVDYYQFWIVGRARAALDLPNVYSAEGRERMAELGQRLADGAVRSSGRLRACAEYRATVETFGSPFLYALVGRTASGDYDTDLRRFHFASLVAFVAAVIGLAALAGLSLSSGIFAAALLCAVAEPLAADVRTGNIGQLQLGGLCLCLALRRGVSAPRELASGVALGGLIAAKPTLALVAVFIACAQLFDGRTRALARLTAGVLGGAFVGVASGAAFLGSWGAWLDWLRALGGLERVSDISVAMGNFSLAQLVAEAGGPAVARTVTLALLLAVVTVLALGRTRRAERSDDRAFAREYLAVAFGSAAAALTLQLVWLHYYLLLIPLVLLLLRPSRLAERRWVVLGASFAALALLGWPARELLGIANPEVQAPVYVVAAWLSGILGLASAVRDSLRQSASVPAH